MSLFRIFFGLQGLIHEFFGFLLLAPNLQSLFMEQHDGMQKPAENPDNVTTLDQVPPPARCRVVSVPARGVLRKRLLAMGFVPGTKIEVLRAAPFGDPVEYRVKGYCLSLRKDEAKLVSVSTGEEGE